MDKDKLRINLDISSCLLPTLEIKREDEYYYRLAAKEIPKILAKYQEKYKTLSEKEHYHMAMLHFAANMFYQMEKNDTRPYEEEIKKAIKQIEDVMGL